MAVDFANTNIYYWTNFIVAPHCRRCVVSFCPESCRQASLKLRALRFAYVMCSNELDCRETACELERAQEFPAVILHPHDQRFPTIWGLPSRCLLTVIWPSPVSQSISGGRPRDSFGTYVRTEGVKKKHLSGSPGCQWSNKRIPGASILPIFFIRLQKICAWGGRLRCVGTCCKVGLFHV